MKAFNKKFFGWLALTILLLSLDQASKWAIRQNLSLGEKVEVLPNILNWHFLYNTGAAFSSLSGQTFLLALISSIVSVGIIVYSLQIIAKGKTLQIISMSFLLAGALGNLIDRLILGKVTDFIDLMPLPGNFPIFNIADICINIAVFLLILDWLSEGKAKKKHD